MGKFIITEEEKNRIRGLYEQQTTINKEGYNCVKGATHTVCSKKDNYGYMIRVFDNKSFDSNPNELPNHALFQAGGETWEETMSAFESNKRTKGSGLNLPTPVEPQTSQEYDRQKPLRNF